MITCHYQMKMKTDQIIQAKYGALPLQKSQREV